jgi:fumarylacetoacetase
VYALNETHDPNLTSWVQSANQPGTDFPIQNLPFGVFRPAASKKPWRVGVAIGDQVVDLAAVSAGGVFSGSFESGLATDALAACSGQTLNDFMALGPDHWSALRLALSRALRPGATDAEALQPCLVPQDAVEYRLPADIGDYTDFYTSIHHATNVGRQFRPDNPLLPNYAWVPIGYHGRSSSIGVSGQRLPRPAGQTKAPDAETPTVGPSKRMDYELEVGVFIGAGNEAGQPISIEKAEAHVFGLCLLNDWSARDLQAWEYQPLGPFLSKSFASTISPWVVTLEALAPFRLPYSRPADHPQPLPYLDSAENREQGAFDMKLEVLIQTERMREQGLAPEPLARTNFRHSYWTVAQMVAHHTVNGCNLRPGDFFGSGTQSGPDEAEAGSLLELTVGGKRLVKLPGGETRGFLEDGDTVILRGHCENEGAVRIGFGEAVGTLLSAVGEM